jgi:NADPH-dependent ferric siderophore reductase
MTRSKHAAVLKTRFPLTAHMSRLTLAGESLFGLRSLPAQDVEILLRNGFRPALKRRYTIRNARPDLGEIDLGPTCSVSSIPCRFCATNW